MGPVRGGAGDGVETQRGGEAATDAVVIAANGELRFRANRIDDLIGAGAVADDVAEIPEDIEAGGVEDGGKGFEVRVDVGEDEGAHRPERTSFVVYSIIFLQIGSYLVSQFYYK